MSFRAAAIFLRSSIGWLAKFIFVIRFELEGFCLPSHVASGAAKEECMASLRF